MTGVTGNLLILLWQVTFSGARWVDTDPLTGLLVREPVVVPPLATVPVPDAPAFLHVEEPHHGEILPSPSILRLLTNLARFLFAALKVQPSGL